VFSRSSCDPIGKFAGKARSSSHRVPSRESSHPKPKSSVGPKKRQNKGCGFHRLCASPAPVAARRAARRVPGELGAKRPESQHDHCLLPCALYALFRMARPDLVFIATSASQYSEALPSRRYVELPRNTWPLMSAALHRMVVVPADGTFRCSAAIWTLKDSMPACRSEESPEQIRNSTRLDGRAGASERWYRSGRPYEP
jgi:hypothetical protein